MERLAALFIPIRTMTVYGRGDVSEGRVAAEGWSAAGERAG